MTARGVPSVDGIQPATVALRGRLEAVARRSGGNPVFIAGEPGSGRRHAARVLHAQGGGGQFRALCAAEAEIGARLDRALRTVEGPTTVYIDRVHDLAPPDQEVLTRAILSGLPPGLRVVTSHPMPRDGRPTEAGLSGDLRYRLEAVVVPIPPARDRAGDVPQIALAMLEGFSASEGRAFRGLSDEVAEIFRRHAWPGNLRELENVIRTVVLLNDGPLVTADMLPPGLRQVSSTASSPLDELLGQPLAAIERYLIETVIARQGGSIPRAARSLGISPSTIYRKIEAWDRGGAIADDRMTG